MSELTLGFLEQRLKSVQDGQHATRSDIRMLTSRLDSIVNRLDRMTDRMEAMLSVIERISDRLEEK
jgi:hypothetical protein